MTGNTNTPREPSKKRALKLPERKLLPLNSIICISPTGIATLSREIINSDEVGWKAYGLSSMPAEWVPRFLVIHADSLKDQESEEKLSALLKQGISQAGITSAVVKVRSTGTAETIQYRGRLKSATCSVDETLSAIRCCVETSAKSVPGKVHWIIQEYVQPQRQGHLSNERHVSKEKRDWVAELELKEEVPGYSIPIAVRRWRDGDRISDSSLNCTSELEISFCLKRVAMWAERLLSRMHFEWVWNGSAIRVVQADIADSVSGVDPISLVPSQVPEISIESLSAFRAATAQQYDRYAKLRNAKLYREFGYVMPKFYVLDDPNKLSTILDGTIPVAVEGDLAELTKRPLILRTDGTKIPADKREMLPRSDELRTTNEAKAWLLGSFRSGVKQGDLQQSSLCLIGHHFIPSVASAWARAEPGKRFVRIEALWGLPEGLYWYSHDTYEVDTQDVVIKPKRHRSTLKYSSWERLRYKGTFIAPDEAGKWIPYQTKAPLDWRSTISKQQWLFEIAHTTRLIAEHEKFPVAVMWFIGNNSTATSHAVLPWFHSESELEEAPKAAPRRKLTASGDFKLHSNSDWESLRQQAAAGKRIERVIVEPTDFDLIRNADFARDLADFAALNKIVIELAGGVLSHAYYILHRQGAQVECTDLFGAEEEVAEYNKLVRDRIPAIIEARGERVEVVRLSGDALTSALRQKLVEEAFEALDAKSGDDLVGELADLEEIISGLRRALKLGKAQIEAERLDKQKRRGGFQRGYMLTRTSTPHSLQRLPLEATLDLHPKAPQNVVISRPADIPSTPPYRRPDLRQVEQEVEKLFVFEADIKEVTNLTETVNFTLPIHDGNPREFSLTVEIRRNRASLRSSVRLRLRPAQLSIHFPDSQVQD
jgi:predicted house-cleaning noncanonical NTP pyrophosphatase (MazG superfamily)